MNGHIEFARVADATSAWLKRLPTDPALPDTIEAFEPFV